VSKVWLLLWLTPALAVDSDSDSDSDAAHCAPADWYPDADRDGFPAAGTQPVSACMPPLPRFIALGPGGFDCDDHDPQQHPGHPELCDGVDNDCDQQIDEGVTPPIWYPDRDGDGFVASGPIVAACEAPADHAERGSDPHDCDDGRRDVHPGAPEVCDRADNDCDDQVDEGVPPNTWYPDRDGDGAPARRPFEVACTQPMGHVAEPAGSFDCDDREPLAFPGGVEACDGIDNDCDGQIDVGAPGTQVFYEDADKDGRPDRQASEAWARAPECAPVTDVRIEACEPPPGFVPIDPAQASHDDACATILPGCGCQAGGHPASQPVVPTAGMSVLLLGFVHLRRRRP